MNLETLSNAALLAALNNAMNAAKESRGSANLKKARRNALASIKAECQRRITLGAW